MANEQLIAYIKGQLAAGQTSEQIKSALIGNGYDVKTTTDAVLEARGVGTSAVGTGATPAGGTASGAATGGMSTGLIIGLIAFFVIIIGGGLFLFTGDSSDLVKQDGGAIPAIGVDVNEPDVITTNNKPEVATTPDKKSLALEELTKDSRCTVIDEFRLGAAGTTLNVGDFCYGIFSALHNGKLYLTNFRDFKVCTANNFGKSPADYHFNTDRFKSPNPTELVDGKLRGVNWNAGLYDATNKYGENMGNPYFLGDVLFIPVAGVGYKEWGTIALDVSAVPTVVGTVDDQMWGGQVIDGVFYTLTQNYTNDIIGRPVFSISSYDFADPTNPVLLQRSRINAKESIPVFSGVHMKDKYMYVNLGRGYSVYDISDINNIKIIEYPFTFKELAIDDNYAYVHNEDGLSVLDISDPVNPVVLKTYDSTISHFQILDNRLYGYGTEEVFIMDISDPVNPIIIYQDVGVVAEVHSIGNTFYWGFPNIKTIQCS